MVHLNTIWQFFDKVGNSKAKCKDCNKLYWLGSDQPRIQTVTALRSHLAKCHDINETFLKKRPKMMVSVSAETEKKWLPSVSNIDKMPYYCREDCVIPP